MVSLNDLRPTSVETVFDLVQKAGFNIADWIASSNNSKLYKSNPKYCYNWSFVEPGTVVILNLWWDVLVEQQDGTIVHRGNFRADAENIHAKNGKPIWVQRAYAMDQALQRVLTENIAIRAILNTGSMRNKGDPLGEASKVNARGLDAVPWALTSYDWNTGEHVLTRGILDRHFVDQFSVAQAEKIAPERLHSSRTDFVRDPKIRASALSRANGRCELCNAVGFKMASGAIYLETHHVVPLCEGGPDHITNVAALCPNDHRMAHFGLDSVLIQKRLLDILSGLGNSKSN